MLDSDHPVRRRLRRARRGLSSGRRVWRRALPSEVEFWRQYIESAGGEFPAEYRARLDPSAPITDPVLLDALDGIPGSAVRILDVGAGPLSAVGSVDPHSPRRRIELVAVDPLAIEYASLLAACGVSAPIPTRPCRGEDVARSFGPEAFDIAYARNSVDHSADALAVIKSMLEAVRVGGKVVLHHYRREAEVMRYEELHQWNFDVHGGRLVVFNRRRRYDLAHELGSRARVSAEVHAGGYHAPWVAATIVRATA